MLTNAIYFKGKWRKPFDRNATNDALFHITKDKQAVVPMMHKWNEFQYGSVDGIQVIELVYGDCGFSMVVVLPKEIDGIADLERRLTAEKLTACTSGLKREEVEVCLPKFKMTSAFQLDRVLDAMGMPLAFDSAEADFSGMTGKRDLFLSAVVHKAFIDVNEEGTEAATATALAKATAPPPTAVFRADHPFLFLIRDNGTGSILFMGTSGESERRSGRQEKHSAADNISSRG